MVLPNLSNIYIYIYLFASFYYAISPLRDYKYNLYSQTWNPTPGVGKLLVVLCRSNVAKSLIVPTHPSPPYFCIQQPLKHVNLILSKLSFWRDVKTGTALKELYASVFFKDSILYEIIITLFQFTQRAIENRSTCHAWHACRRLPTPALHYLVHFKLPT